MTPETIIMQIHTTSEQGVDMIRATHKTQKMQVYVTKQLVKRRLNIERLLVNCVRSPSITGAHCAPLHILLRTTHLYLCRSPGTFNKGLSYVRVLTTDAFTLFNSSVCSTLGYAACGYPHSRALCM